MNIEKLQQDIIDQIKESQIKLGYASETVRLYYRNASLARIIGVSETDPDKLAALLNEEPQLKKGPLGELAFSSHVDRVEVRVLPEGVRYVHECTPLPQFLANLIDLFSKCHHPSKEQILATFSSSSPDFELLDMPAGSEFDYSVHFCDESIDSHYYCFKDEFGHVIYHRFVKEDYLPLLD